MWKFTRWRLALLVVVVLFAAYLAAAQAITLAWLSAFPECALQLESLEKRFWVYAILSAVLAIIGTALFVRLVRQLTDRYNRSIQSYGDEAT